MQRPEGDRRQCLGKTWFWGFRVWEAWTQRPGVSAASPLDTCGAQWSVEPKDIMLDQRELGCQSMEGALGHEVWPPHLVSQETQAL